MAVLRSPLRLATPHALSKLLKEAGFHLANIQALGGWDLSLSQCLGLCLRRRPMNCLTRLILSGFLFPIYLLLVGLGRRELVAFQEGQMITGLVAGAWASGNR